MAGVNSHFATISEGSETLKIQEDAVPENTKIKKSTKSVVEITQWGYTKTIIILFNLGE